MKTPQSIVAWIAALAISSVAATASADGVSSWFGGGDTKQLTPSGTKVDNLGNTVQSPWQKMKSSVGGVGSSVKRKFQRDDKNVPDAKSKKDSNDALSLGRDAHPSVEFYLSVARMQERSNNVSGAIEQCKRALEVDSKNLAALLALARLYDRQDQLGEATNYYLQAIKYHPQEASVHNDLGLCYARQEKYEPAAQQLRKAIELQPDRVLYRNNLATILIETGRVDQALDILTVVHGPTVAHYNVGFLLNKRGQTAAALEQFQLAVKADPTFEAARQWVDSLSAGQSSAPQVAGRSVVTRWSDTQVTAAPVASAPVATAPVEIASREQPVVPAPQVKAATPQAPAAAPPAQETVHTDPASDSREEEGDAVLTTRGTRGPVLHMPGPSEQTSAAQRAPAASPAPASKPIASVARRDPRMPPTPDQIRQYSRDPVTGQPLVQPLPPVDAQHYPPSRY